MATHFSANKAKGEMFTNLLQKVDELAEVEGIRQLDLLSLAAPLNVVFSTLTRRGAITTSELAHDLGLTLNQTEVLVELLVHKGYLTTTNPETDQAAGYKVRFAAPKKREPSKIWNSLDF